MKTKDTILEFECVNRAGGTTTVSMTRESEGNVINTQIDTPEKINDPEEVGHTTRNLVDAMLKVVNEETKQSEEESKNDDSEKKPVADTLPKCPDCGMTINEYSVPGGREFKLCLKCGFGKNHIIKTAGQNGLDTIYEEIACGFQPH